MTLSNLPTDATELYLRGELDAATTAQYELQLKADPVLQSELDLHQELVKGFGMAKRRVELKQMLQNTPVSGAGNMLFQNPLTQWLAAGFASVAVVSTLWLVNQPVEPIAGPVISQSKSTVKTAPIATPENSTTDQQAQTFEQIEKVEEVAQPAPIETSEATKANTLKQGQDKTTVANAQTKT